MAHFFKMFFLFIYFSFHHFPHFHVQNGKPGDSLIWDPEKNELLIADTSAQHHVLCHWQKDETGKRRELRL
jgi:hypothetical protein